MKTLVYSETDIAELRKSFEAETGWGGVAAAVLRKTAREAGTRRTACLTEFPSPAASGSPHDYFSEGPYWWPDPKNPGGPFVRRDGERYPGRFVHHERALKEVCRHALALAQAGALLDDEEAYAAAAEKLRAFFVDPATRMSPHMDYAQAVRGVCPGRGIGIIDGVCLLRAVEATLLLEAAGVAPDVTAGVRVWSAAFHRWLRTSRNGIDERNAHNNHSMWYTAISMAFARLLGDTACVASDAEYFGTMMSRQLNADGSFADELKRTNSFGYCAFNLTGAATVAELARGAGIDLWRAEFAEGRGLRRAVEWMAPYVLRPLEWKWTQISGRPASAPFAFALAARRLDGAAAETAAGAVRTQGVCDGFADAVPFGPVAFLFPPAIC